MLLIRWLDLLLNTLCCPPRITTSLTPPPSFHALVSRFIAKYLTLTGCYIYVIAIHSQNILGHSLLADLRILAHLSKLGEESGRSRIGCHFHIYHRELNANGPYCVEVSLPARGMM